MTEKTPPWWPTAEQKLHADAGCAHPDVCRVAEPRCLVGPDCSKSGTLCTFPACTMATAFTLDPFREGEDE